MHKNGSNRSYLLHGDRVHEGIDYVQYNVNIFWRLGERIRSMDGAYHEEGRGIHNGKVW